MNNKLEPKDKTTAFSTGVVVALLLAGGAFLGFKDKLTPPPVVQTVTVEKVVEKVVVKRVATTNTVTEKKLFKAQLVDNNGNVTKEWEVAKCKFKVIGATLTDKNGNTFVVRGHIRVRPINAPAEKATAVSDLPESDSSVVDDAVFASDGLAK